MFYYVLKNFILKYKYTYDIMAQSFGKVKNLNNLIY